MKNFLKVLGLLAVSFFALIGLGATILTISLILMIGQISSQQVDRTAAMDKKDLENSYVRIDINGPITTIAGNPRDEIFAEIFGEPTGAKLADLESTLKRAAEDIRVHGVYVDLKNFNARLTTIIALRRALMDFRKSEKPLWINMNAADTSAYLLASTGSQVNLAPMGGVMIPGPAFQLTYFGSALEKLGLDVEVFRAGKYKSAMEAFINDKPSDPTLEMYRSLEQSIRESLVHLISQGRQRSKEDVLSWLKQSIFSSQEALEKGLIDKVAYGDAFLQEFKEVAKSDNEVKWKAYLANSSDIDEPRIHHGSEKIGYIEAVGEIRMNVGREEKAIAPGPVIKELKWLAENDDVKAVVFRVDSPGGSALASDLIWEEVRKLAEIKPVVVSMGSVAASGGYYISAGATKIFAEAETITGSIGVIGAAFNGKPFAKKYGVSFHMVTQSDRGKYLSFGEKASEEDKRVINKSIDEVYNTFLTKVGQGRSKTKDQVHQIAQGRVWSGVEALEIGLVDHIGGRREAFVMAKKLAELNPDKLYRVAKYQPKPKSIFDCLGNRENWLECVQELENKISANLKLNVGVPQEIVNPLEKVKAMIEDDQVLMYWPGQLMLNEIEDESL